MKKGATHVDWAISMGIFLIYVLLTFIFLKPTSQPAYSGDTLLDTVYTGLENDTTFTVQRGYLIIKPTINCPADGCVLRIKGVSSYLGEGWKLSEDQGLNHLTMFNESLGKVPSNDLEDVAFDFKNEYCISNPSQCTSVDADVLDIKTKLKNNEDNVFWFVYSEGETYGHPTASITYDDGTCQAENPPGMRTNNCLLNYCKDPTCPNYIKNDFTYEFGVIETYSGFSDTKLDTLKVNYPESTKYNDLKKAWGFPEDKNFQITIEGT